jgi:hypothetical protein
VFTHIVFTSLRLAVICIALAVLTTSTTTELRAKSSSHENVEQAAQILHQLLETKSSREDEDVERSTQIIELLSNIYVRI